MVFDNWLVIYLCPLKEKLFISLLLQYVSGGKALNIFAPAVCPLEEKLYVSSLLEHVLVMNTVSEKLVVFVCCLVSRACWIRRPFDCC